MHSLLFLRLFLYPRNLSLYLPNYLSLIYVSVFNFKVNSQCLFQLLSTRWRRGIQNVWFEIIIIQVIYIIYYYKLVFFWGVLLLIPPLSPPEINTDYNIIKMRFV